MATYDWSEFTVRSYYRAPLEKVFRAWATPAGLASFFIGRAVHSRPGTAELPQDELVQAGDEYAWRYVHEFEGRGRILECTENERVRFTFGDMEVAVSVRQVGEQVEVTLRQSGCATEDPGRAWSHLNCRSCWVYFMTNLKAVLEHGIDLRDHEAPQLNDAVSIGFAPAGESPR